MTENIDKGFIVRQLMTYGAIIGVITIIYSLILFATGTNEFIGENDSFTANLRVIIVGLGIFYSIRHYSDKILKERIKFWKFILYGTAIGFFFSIIDSAYFVVFANYIAPETIDKMMELAKPQYIQLGFSDTDLEMVTNVLKKPFTLFFTFLVQNTLLSAVYSILFAILYTFMNSILPKKKK